MTDDNPYQQMAREFLDLWQKQLAMTVNDKQFIQATLDMLRTMQNLGDYEQKREKAAASDPADADDAGHGGLADLARRLALCERRLDALEGARRSSGGAAKSRRKGSKNPRG